ncbi:uncharacterized protein LOC110692626 [Chenopodium quinoa]|uniref:uncharacterized protein LOC110692626 n=1 Tax=Chenopodium quinoa TaxID=63459 RepID=UPI000B76F2D2|nr:uncharacterized protein LOC110692626 [Chenopodium quinoa]
MNFKLLSPLRNRLHTLLRSDVAWPQRRYLGTAATAAQEILNKRRTGKRIPAHERKAMVEAYVNKYRVMNSGKFPTTKNVTNQIGGSHYKTKVIIQELEYKSKLPTVASAADKLTILQKAQPYQFSEVKAIVDCKLSGKDKRNTVVDDGTSAECYLSYEIDKISDQKMIDMSTLNKNHEITAEYESGSEKKVWGEHGRASADMDTSENSRILESCIVPGISTVMESTLASETLIAMSTENSEIFVMPSHRIEAPKTSQNVTIGNLDEASAPASKCDKLPRVTTTKKHDVVEESQQSSLWGSLKFFASNVISRWRKT